MTPHEYKSHLVNEFKLNSVHAYHTANIIPDGEHTLFELEYYIRLIDPPTLRIMADFMEGMTEHKHVEEGVYLKLTQPSELMVVALRVKNSAMAKVTTLNLHSEE